MPGRPSTFTFVPTRENGAGTKKNTRLVVRVAHVITGTVESVEEETDLVEEGSPCAAKRMILAATTSPIAAMGLFALPAGIADALRPTTMAPSASKMPIAKAVLGACSSTTIASDAVGLKVLVDVGSSMP